MRPRVGWPDLRGARVGVWGARVEGAANVRRLLALGAAPRVLVDDSIAGPVEGLDVVTAAGGGLEALARCEVVVKSPGVSRHRPEVAALEAAGVLVVGGLGLWLEELGAPGRERVLCVTGSKGKSTTTAIAGHLASGLGRRPFVGGNIGLPPWDPAATDDADLWVVETSSFQAADVSCSPPVVVVTSLSPDHLDWHGDVETYYADKLSLCTQPGARVTIANGDDPVLRAHAGQLGPEVRWAEPAGGGAASWAWTDRLELLGAHNRSNALLAAAALAVAGVDGADDPSRLATAAAGFDPLPSRLRPIAQLEGVSFVDDSLATNVLPTLAALDVFADRRVALLAGGHDRGIDYAPLAAHLLARRHPTLVLALPDSGARILSAVEAAGGAGGGLELQAAADLAPAVEEAWRWAQPDGVVLLSPAAASFGHYRDYRDRSAAFAAAVAACAAGASDA